MGYYCCATEYDLPAAGTPARMASDFFRTSVGQHLPSLLFVSLGAGLLVAGLRRGRRGLWLPFLFVLLNLTYFFLDFQLIGLSWSISNAVAGPVTSAYKGYDHTWYGIVLHLLLWVAYFGALAWAAGQRLRRR